MNGGRESMKCLSTSLLIKELPFTSGSIYDKESSQVHSFSPRRLSFLPPWSPPLIEIRLTESLCQRPKSWQGWPSEGEIKRVPFHCQVGGQGACLPTSPQFLLNLFSRRTARLGYCSHLKGFRFIFSNIDVDHIWKKLWMSNTFSCCFFSNNHIK